MDCSETFSMTKCSSLSERPVDSLILTGDLKIKDFFK